MPKRRQTANPGCPLRLSDIALRCGVAKGTVSKALNHSRLINPNTAEHIRQVAQEMGYDPMAYHEARRLSARRSGRRILNHLIAVLFPAYYYQNNYHNLLYHGILDRLTREHYGVLTVAMPDSRFEKSRIVYPPSILRGEVDGAIFIGYLPDDDPLVSARDSGFPLVSMINPFPGCAQVTAGDEEGGYLLVKHLLDLGHRHFAYIHAELVVHAMNLRMVGMRRAISDAGLDPDTHLHFLVTDVNRPLYYPPFVDLPTTPTQPSDSVMQRVCGFLDEHPAITAIIAQNDKVAQDLWYLLKRAGRCIPQDYSLVGYDDTDPMLDEFGVNILTSIRVPLMAIGSSAAQLTIDLLNGNATPDTRLELPTSLVIRASTMTPCTR